MPITWSMLDYSLSGAAAHRLRTFNTVQLNQRIRVAEEFAKSLRAKFRYPGNRAAFHSFWVFAILLSTGTISWRNSTGADSMETASGSALSVIDPPAGRENWNRQKRRGLSKITLPAGVSQSSGPGTQAAKQSDCRDFRAVPSSACYRRATSLRGGCAHY